MKIGTFINHGTIIEIESIQTMNLSVDKGQVCVDGKSLQDFIGEHAESTIQEEDADDAPETIPSESEGGLEPFTEAQQKASGIKMQAGVTLALMREMQPRFTQKVDWLSFYSVLLRRGWVDNNMSAFCRMVFDLFGVKLDGRTLSTDLKKNGPDYTRWTEADDRILRRKQLAADFDNRLTEYFERKRAEVLKGVR